MRIRERDIERAIREEAFIQSQMAQVHLGDDVDSPSIASPQEPARDSFLMRAFIATAKVLTFAVVWIVHHVVRLVSWLFLAAGSWLKDEMDRAKSVAEFGIAHRAAQTENQYAEDISAPEEPVVAQPSEEPVNKPQSNTVTSQVALCDRCETPATYEWLSPTGTMLQMCGLHRMSDHLLAAGGWSRIR